jgi:putative membrane-bound dehydrogenase-like protein
MTPFSFLALTVVFAAAVTAAESPAPDARELPRFPAVEARDALKTFAVKQGFHLELVASEPQITSPVAISFDDNGRLFVLEMRDYSEQRDVEPHLGQVRLLEDTDNDGRYDRATVFAENLPWPTALLWANGGLYVCAAPDLLRFDDTDGDGKADTRRVLFTGFNSGTAKLNVQALPNSLAWGPDNRIHLQTGGGNRGVIRSVARDDLPPQELGGRDFWFDPRSLAFGFEAGGGQFGMSYDNGGIRFVCNNSDHLRVHLFDSSYLARNRFAAVPSPLVSIAADGPAAEVFRISPDEPWRVIRTRWRVAGKVSGPVEGGGRVSGYFTGATGTTVYRGDAFGPEFVGNTFTGDAGGNLVHRKRVRADGASYVGARPDDELRSEFVASRDTWFRPVNFANAPDGTLYIIDMYREVIEHPWSIPETIKQHLDLTSGRDRGRIWRIAPNDFKLKPPPRLGEASLEDLVAALSHTNGWHRDAATRLLSERRDPRAPQLLAALLAKNGSGLGRLHALRTLDGVGALSPDILSRALADADENVRAHAIRLSEKFQEEGHLPKPLLEALRACVDDSAPRVRLQLALTLGGCVDRGAQDVLVQIAKRGSSDHWIRAAICTVRPEAMGVIFNALALDNDVGEKPHGVELLSALARSIGARGDREEIERALEATVAREEQWPVTAALAEGVAGAGHALDSIVRVDKLAPVVVRARETVRDKSKDAPVRAAAAALLALARTDDSRDALIAALRSEPPVVVAQTALDALRKIGVSPAALIGEWKAFSESVRRAAVQLLVARPDSCRALLDAIRVGTIAAADVSTAQQSELQHHRDAAIAADARKLFPIQIIETRASALKRFEAATTMRGDAAVGQTLFTQRCATCHRFRGEGNAFGPDLESVATGGKEKLLAHIIEPDREVAPQFAAYVAELTDGSSLAGVVASESAETIVLKEPLGREHALPRSRVVRLQTTGRSPMPEGLESGLTVAEMAGLLEFIAGSKGR